MIETLAHFVHPAADICHLDPGMVLYTLGTIVGIPIQVQILLRQLMVIK